MAVVGQVGLRCVRQVFCDLRMFGSLYNDWKAVLDIGYLAATSCFVSFTQVKSTNFSILTPDLLQCASRHS